MNAVSSKLAVWILKMMLILQPANVTPWAETYASTAEVFANEAISAPLFSGESAAIKTASVLISVAWYEGRFDPQAKGDCKEKKNGKCVSAPQSICMFQIGISNLSGLHVTQEELLSDVAKCTRSARTMMKISFGVCKSLGFEESLGHYASGGDTCGGLRESRNRIKTAMWLFGKRNE